MTTPLYSYVPLSLRITLVTISTLLVLATSVDVAAQSPSISVRDAVVVEGNSGTAQATFAIALSGPSSQSVSLSFATANGTATAGVDYVATSGAVTFAPGEVEKPVVVIVNGDTVDEAQETFFLDISNVQNATVSSSRGTGFIFDDDGPTIRINDVSVTEGNSGTKAATFTLTLSGPSVEAIAVRAITAQGTSTAASDYNSVKQVVIFNPGTVTRTLDVGIIGDTNLESNETFSVNLSEPFGTTIADGQGLGTILDDDTLLVLEESGPAPQQAVAFESLRFTPDPIRGLSILDRFNHPVGQNTIFMI
jgi:serralysin